MEFPSDSFVDFLSDSLWNFRPIHCGNYTSFFVEFPSDLLWNLHQLHCGISVRFIVEVISDSLARRCSVSVTASSADNYKTGRCALLWYALICCLYVVLQPVR